VSAPVRNRDALRDYTIDSTVEAGIVLTGAEVKSIRLGRAGFSGGYAVVEKRWATLHGLHIEAYKFASADSKTTYDPIRPRRLLLKASELARLKMSTQAEGYTLVPLSMYFKQALIKVELGLGKGKKKYDKRQELKTAESKRETDRYFKYSRR
jgi:SsrA-binding protein